jgi:UDP-3-O-[3-hydroxymyristoyl] N-acetylglucosamine deacetylase/3-hydroxyacyl-[acyl-carrier-protein] dehydratase
MQYNQRTIKDEVCFAGRGLHTGAAVEMTLRGAPCGHGIKFVRTDLDGEPVIPALAEYVAETTRSTSLRCNGVGVSTIEHLMGALFALGIDNVLIRINAAEAPIMDGSGREYVERLRPMIEEQSEMRAYLEIKDRIEVKSPDGKSEIVVYPSSGFGVTVNVDFGSRVLGHQYACVHSAEAIADEVADSRTFVFFHELEQLHSRNLIRGGDAQNAIVVVENDVEPCDIERISALFHTPKLQRLPSGYLNNVTLRYDNEPARHKLLDLAGDLYLAGMPLRGNVMALRPGHSTNALLAMELRRLAKKHAQQPPRYDPNDKALYDISAIMKILPHRPPFLLLDRIVSMTATEIVGIKNVTMNEGFFIGHFPDEPVMPGVLIVEAMAQCGGILALSNVPDPQCYSTYFLKIDAVKFKRKVVPGDTLLFRLTLVEPIRRGLVHMSAQAFVGSTLAVESDLLAQVTRNRGAEGEEDKQR